MKVFLFPTSAVGTNAGLIPEKWLGFISRQRGTSSSTGHGAMGIRVPQAPEDTTALPSWYKRESINSHMSLGIFVLREVLFPGGEGN